MCMSKYFFRTPKGYEWRMGCLNLEGILELSSNDSNIWYYFSIKRFIVTVNRVYG